MIPRVVLMIDDDPDSFDRVRRYLDRDLYDLHYASDPYEGVELAKELQPDSIILDIRMPELDGYDVCERLRSHEVTQRIPIIIYSVLGNEDPAFTRSLNLGAHAVVEKEKLSRLGAALKRFAGEEDHVTPSVCIFYREGHELKVQGEAERVWLDGHEKVLRPKELEVLAYLAAQPGVFVSTDQLGEAVWGSNWEYMVKGNVHRLINGLRAKLEPIPGKRLFIDSQRGGGYRLRGGYQGT